MTKYQSLWLVISFCVVRNMSQVGGQSWMGYITSASAIFTENWPTINDILDNKSIFWKTLFQYSYTHETTKAKVNPSDVAKFPPLHEKKSRQNLDCNRDVYMYFVSFGCEETTLLETKSDVTKLWNQNDAILVLAVICHTINHSHFSIGFAARCVRTTSMFDYF